MIQRVRAKVADLWAWLDGLAQRVTHAGLTWLLPPFIYAVTLGHASFAYKHPTWVQQIDTNKVAAADSFKMARWSVATLGILVAVYFAAIVVVRLRTRGWRIIETTALMNRRLAPLAALPVLTALKLTAIERDSPKATLFLIAIAALAVGAGAYAWTSASTVGLGLADRSTSGDDAPPRGPWRERIAKAIAGLSVAAIWAGYGTFFSKLSVLNHRALNTRTTDLGYYDNIFYQSIHGKPLGCSFIKAGYHGSAHFDPLLVLLSPLYLIYPRAELLLVLQSVWLGAGAVPVYLIAHAKLGRRLPSVLLALMYAMYPALQGANMYEFHSLTLLSPILLWLLYFLETDRRWLYWLTLGPVLLCREDVALLMCFVGLYAIVQRRERTARLGWVTILVSLVYFAIVKRYFMTSADIFMSGKDSYSFAYYYEELIPNKNGIGGLVVSLLTNPVYVLKTMLAEPKILYVVTLFLPLAFTPFIARTGRIMLAYGLLFCLLASRGAVYSTHFQYSATILPIAFALTPIALAEVEAGRLAGSLGLDPAKLSRALLAAAFAASVLVTWKYGGLTENSMFKGGFVRVARALTDRDVENYKWVRAQVDTIPKRASVGTTNRLGPHVSNRRDAYFYPDKMHTDWVFIDETELKGGDLEKHTKHLQKGAIVLVSRRDKMALFKKKK